MRKYIAFFKIKFLNSIQYKTPIIFAILTQIIWGLMKVIMFNSFYNSSATNNATMSFEEIRSYIWLEGIFLPLFATWVLDESIINSIIKGDIGYDLIKPTNLYWVWFSKNLANRFSKTFIRFFPVLITAMILPSQYKLPAPASFISLFCFLINTILATLLLTSLSMMIYIITCRILSYSGLKSVAVTITTFLTGGIIPLSFFPSGLRTFLMFTPFAYIQNTALRIYSGNISGMEIIYATLAQFFWIFVVILLGKFFAQKTFDKIVMQGG